MASVFHQDTKKTSKHGDERFTGTTCNFLSRLFCIGDFLGLFFRQWLWLKLVYMRLVKMTESLYTKLVKPTEPNALAGRP